jgi:hypothetical protein
MLWKTATFRMDSKVAEADDLLLKADALMRRHRVFVAGAAEQDEEVANTGQDDVPVLTEVVSSDAVPESPPPASTSVALSKLSSVLAFELEAWLDEELPQHVMRVLDGITDQLIIQLSSKAKSELLPRLQSILESTEEAAKPGSADD